MLEEKAGSSDFSVTDPVGHGYAHLLFKAVLESRHADAAVIRDFFQLDLAVQIFINI